MGIKVYKLMINGCCNMIFLDFVEIIINIFEKLLFVLLKNKVGCNNNGCIIVCY